MGTRGQLSGTGQVCLSSRVSSALAGGPQSRRPSSAEARGGKRRPAALTLWESVVCSLSHTPNRVRPPPSMGPGCSGGRRVSAEETGSGVQATFPPRTPRTEGGRARPRPRVSASMKGRLIPGSRIPETAPGIQTHPSAPTTERPSETELAPDLRLSEPRAHFLSVCPRPGVLGPWEPVDRPSSRRRLHACRQLSAHRPAARPWLFWSNRPGSSGK